MRYIAVIFLFFMIFANFFCPNNPIAIDLENKLLSSSLQYPLGTDYLGRCILSRALVGMQLTFFSGLFVTTFATILGMIFGIIIGVSNRYVEEILLRFTDIFDSFPSIVIVLIVTSIFGGSAYSLGFALFLTSWTNYTRVSRNLTKELLTKEFIMISKLLNKKRYKIVVEDLLPNVFPKILIIASNSFAGVVLSLAGYSFLGFGVRAPYSELGMMVSEGKDYIYTRPEMIAVPGIIIFFMVICINIFGENIKKKYELKKE